MAANSIQVPYQVPIFGSNGGMNPQWLAYFNSISYSVGATSVDANQVIQIVDAAYPNLGTDNDYSIPPAPVGVVVEGGFSGVFISWTAYDKAKPKLQYAEIYRSNSPSFNYAIPVGTAIVNIFMDTPPYSGMGHTYYYWVRFVSTAGVPGPFNAVAGTPGGTSPNPDYMLNLLNGALTEDQLYNTLIERINLIDAPTTGLVDGLAKESLDRIDAINAEQNSRITSVNNEQTAREDLAVQLRGEYTGTDVNQLVTGLIYSESNARITQDNALAQQISLLTAGVAGGFDPYQTWYFDATTEGWSGAGATVTQSSGSEGIPGVIVVTSTSTNPQIYLTSDFINAIVGNKYSTVRIRIKRTGGSSSSWNGTLYYKTPSHNFSASYKLQIANPVLNIGDIASLDWDMSILSDWLNSNITNIRIDIGAAATDVFEIDWIAVGRNAPGASAASLLDEAITRASADTAEATSRQTLSSKVTGVADPTGLTLNMLTAGLLYDERTARSTADSTEVSIRQQLSATITGYNDPTGKTLADINSGILYEEKSARVTADSAMASSISTLTATTNSNTSSILALNNVSSTSTSTNAATLYAVSSKVNNPTTGLDSKATVTELTTTDTTLLKAVASAMTQTSTTLNGQTTTIEQVAKSIDGVSGSYTVKVDANGKVTGFGLAVEPNDGAPISKFEVVADKFAIASDVATDPNGTSSPFFVLTVPTEVPPGSGNILPAGTYLKSAYIGDATITSAKIGRIEADKIAAGNINVALNMTAGSITGGTITGAAIKTNTNVGSYGYGGIKIVGDTLYVYDQYGTVRVKIGYLA